MKKSNKANVYKIEANETGISFYWDKEDCGFGVYTIRFGDSTYNSKKDYTQQEIIGFSEAMDDNDDKSFLEELLESVVKNINIVE